MHTNLSTLVLTLSLAAAPALSLAGPTDTTGPAAPANLTEATRTVAAVPTTRLPATCSGDVCSGSGAATFSATPVTSYPPSPCTPDGACTYINVTAPTRQ